MDWSEKLMVVRLAERRSATGSWLPRGSSRVFPEYRLGGPAVFDDTATYGALRWIYRRVRGDWLAWNRRSGIRTFWYAEHDVMHGRVVERPVRMIGRYVPSRKCGYESDDYDPAYLDVWTRQQVYRVYVDCGQWSPGNVLVHPGDVDDA